MNDDELMTAEEFFGEIDEASVGASRMSPPRRVKTERDLFSKVKEKMVMSIYGVSRSKAHDIIARREAEIKAYGKE